MQREISNVKWLSEGSATSHPFAAKPCQKNQDRLADRQTLQVYREKHSINAEVVANHRGGKDAKSKVWTTVQMKAVAEQACAVGHSKLRRCSAQNEDH